MHINILVHHLFLQCQNLTSRTGRFFCKNRFKTYIFFFIRGRLRPITAAMKNFKINTFLDYSKLSLILKQNQ